MNWLRVGAVVVGGAVPGVVEAEFGAELDGGAEPVVPGDGVFGVAVLVAGALAFFVVEVVAAEGDEVVGRELLVEVVDDGEFGGGAADLAGEAVGGVGAGFGGDGAVDGGDLGLIHVPGFGGHVEGL